MRPPTRLLSFLVISSLFFVPFLCAQDNPLNDPDLKEMLKVAQEMQKKATKLQNPAAPDTKKKLAETLSQEKEEEARQEQQEKHEKEKLQAALKKQLEAPGPVVLPDWTPATPEFKAAGVPAKRIVDDEVRIVQIGTSSLTPEKRADRREAGTKAGNSLNQSINKINLPARSRGSCFSALAPIPGKKWDSRPAASRTVKLHRWKSRPDYQSRSPGATAH